ncbi:MAG: hypothetical protein RBU45_03440 [Myxococcota bacterium]|jgi:hypothetical protein|nr:hypothetical protein [Myxococcota bacterium]
MRFEEVREQAEEALGYEDALGAFELLLPLLDPPDGLREPGQWTDALELLARVTAETHSPPLAERCQLAASRPDDPAPLLELARAALEAELPGLAVAALARARAREPERLALLEEQVAALETMGLHREAARLLQESTSRTPGAFLTRYLLAFNLLLAGELRFAREALTTLGPPADATERFLQARLAGMLARAEVVAAVTPLDADDLRGWHFVISGGLLLLPAPPGTPGSDRGRWERSEDDETRCRQALARLAGVLSALALAPPRVLSFPDRENETLALAAAELLGVPCAPFAPSAGPGLVVAYDLARVLPELVATLHHHAPGQLLWAHAARWTREQPVVGDLLSFLYRRNVSPWERHLILDPRRTDLPAGPPAEPPAELATRLMGRPLVPNEADEADKAALLGLTRAAAAAPPADRPALLQTDGVRERLWIGSPVPHGPPHRDP